MRLNDDRETVAAMDVLAPGIGEIIGGSQREERLDVLDASMLARGINKDHYEWYRDLRRYGTTLTKKLNSPPSARHSPRHPPATTSPAIWVAFPPRVLGCPSQNRLLNEGLSRRRNVEDRGWWERADKKTCPTERRDRCRHRSGRR